MHENTVNQRGLVDAAEVHLVRTATDLGQAIRARRRAQRLTQDELALLAGSHRNRVAEIERGGETERLQLLLKLVNELGLELIVQPRNVRRGMAAQVTEGSPARPG